MNIIDLLTQDGINPKYKATTNGGEYASACPDCGGEDRFRCWPKQGRGGKWWCRQCEKSGDLIQYLRDFRDKSYAEACHFLKIQPNSCASDGEKVGTTTLSKHTPSKADPPPSKWQKIMQRVVEESGERLRSSRYKYVKKWMKARGLKAEAIERYSLGWNDENLTYQRASLGLPEKVDDQGHASGVWIPEGLVIPCYRNNLIHKVSIRRSAWRDLDTPPSHGAPRYVMVPGSSAKANMLLGEVKKYAVVVESDLDAILLHQLAGDIVTVIAMGSVANKPDYEVTRLLRRAKVFLVALDGDGAGMNATRTWWLPHFPNGKWWLVINGKDPGEAYRLGDDLRLWIRAGLPDKSSLQ
jgi:DNA primase